MMLGTPQPLHPGEIELAGAINLMPNVRHADLGILEHAAQRERLLAAATSRAQASAAPQQKPRAPRARRQGKKR